MWHMNTDVAWAGGRDEGGEERVASQAELVREALLVRSLLDASQEGFAAALQVSLPSLHFLWFECSRGSVMQPNG